MTSSAQDRCRRYAAAANALTVIAVAAGALAVAIGGRVPQAWWPHTGQAFAAETRAAGQDRCALIAGPARDYCGRGATTTASAKHAGGADPAWRVVPASAGVGALVVWRLPSAAGTRRR
jgi:hypothetical protein